MRFLFLMDPMEGILTAKDTTFALMLAAAQRGHVIEHALPLQLFADGRDRESAELFVRSAPALVWRKGEPGADDGWKLGERRVERVCDFDAVFIRNDPPFDANYAWMTQLLELVRDRTFVMNDPRGLRDANEKLYALHFTKWMAKTLVTASPAHIKEWVREIGGEAVIKPLDGMAGSGVFLLRSTDRNFNAIVEATIGETGRRWCMVQEYLPAARIGDKRILLLDGEPLGAILRVPRDDEARANIHAGGSVEKVPVTDEERAMIKDLAPRLAKDGLYFVGLDVIGGKLTEVNVTSPTGIQQMSRFDGVDYPGRVIEWVEKKSKR
ncbi:MAG: glutathione synthase [Polyangiales bacterium]